MSNDDTSDDDDNHGVTSILTPSELLKIGLNLVGFTRRRIRRAKTTTNMKRFKSFFGSSPAVIAMIWEDLQKTRINEARVPPQDRKIKYILMAMHHLKCYPTEIEREGMFDISAMWGRDWVWYFVEKVQALKGEKIVWPDDLGGENWVITVDGTHCWIQEPQHPTWSQDSQFYSHKYGKAGLNYELGIVRSFQFPSIVFIIMFGIIIFVIVIVTSTTITTKVTCCQNQRRDRNRHRLVVRHVLSKIREECLPGEQPPHRQFVGSFSLVWLAQ
jgi:hypothetical protein